MFHFIFFHFDKTKRSKVHSKYKVKQSSMHKKIKAISSISQDAQDAQLSRAKKSPSSNFCPLYTLNSCVNPLCARKRCSSFGNDTISRFIKGHIKARHNWSAPPLSVSLSLF